MDNALRMVCLWNGCNNVCNLAIDLCVSGKAKRLCFCIVLRRNIFYLAFFLYPSSITWRLAPYRATSEYAPCTSTRQFYEVLLLSIHLDYVTWYTLTLTFIGILTLTLTFTYCSLAARNSVIHLDRIRIRLLHQIAKWGKERIQCQCQCLQFCHTRKSESLKINFCHQQNSVCVNFVTTRNFLCCFPFLL